MVESPCVLICRLNDEGICVGCKRTREEISKWSKYTDEEKQKVIERIKEDENRT